MAKKKSNEELTEDIKNLETKIRTLEKFINEDKKQKDISLGKLEKTSRDIDNGLKSVQIELRSTNSSFTDKYKVQEKLLKKTISEFNAFQSELEAELEKVAEKDQIMEDLRSQVKEKDIFISERDKNLKKIEAQYEEALNKLAKLKAEFESLEIIYEQTKTLQDELKKNLESTEKEYTDFKSKEEPIMAQNDSIRSILNSTDQGKIYLALVEAHPRSMTIDEIATLIDSTAVLIKSSLLHLEELDVIDFNPATRNVKLPE
ncbi:MAG: hypothetical protein KAU62_16975 [Candidatus Heimdallarchaeota archaeon]|nr:hypothetical protein [Candidatus Heimdallarchaeota archaeon]MCG3257802.1 hypothetical protein [Candidatus Heimdallarchaeota archaeon]MCK4612852.1 hypothetical protein [Candidatus Heimdallarchaeota archaeon]